MCQHMYPNGVTFLRGPLRAEQKSEWVIVLDRPGWVMEYLEGAINLLVER